MLATTTYVRLDSTLVFPEPFHYPALHLKSSMSFRDETLDTSSNTRNSWGISRFFETRSPLAKQRSLV
jgi:hypothetical protein